MNYEQLFYDEYGYWPNDIELELFQRSYYRPVIRKSKENGNSFKTILFVIIALLIAWMIFSNQDDIFSTMPSVPQNVPLVVPTNTVEPLNTPLFEDTSPEPTEVSTANPTPGTPALNTHTQLGSDLQTPLLGGE